MKMRVYRGTSTRLHLTLTIITGGAWGLFVWLPLAAWRRIGPRPHIVIRHY